MTTHADWLERNLAAAGRPRTLSDDERRCVEVMASIARLHNLHTPLPITEAIDFGGGAVSVLLHGELATYDGGALTRLVLAAHEHAVRVAISPWASHLDETRAKAIAAEVWEEHGIEIDWEAIPGVLVVLLSPREPGVTDQCWDGHPTLSDLVERI